MGNGKVAPRQLFQLLLLSRLFEFLAFSPRRLAAANARELVLSAAAGLLLALPLIPALTDGKRGGEGDHSKHPDRKTRSGGLLPSRRRTGKGKGAGASLHCSGKAPIFSRHKAGEKARCFPDCGKEEPAGRPRKTGERTRCFSGGYIRETVPAGVRSPLAARLIFLCFCGSGAAALAEMADFLSLCYPSTALPAIAVVLTLGVAVYALLAGLEGCARFGSLMLWLLAVLLGLSFLSAAGQLSFDRLSHDAADLSTRLLLWQIPFGELAAASVLSAHVTQSGLPKAGTGKRSSDSAQDVSETRSVGHVCRFFVLTSAAVGSGVAVFCEMLLGGSLSQVPYPVFEFASVTHTPLLERLDVLYLVAWLISATMRVLLFAFAAAECLPPAYRLPAAKSGALLPAGAMLLLLALSCLTGFRLFTAAASLAALLILLWGGAPRSAEAAQLDR